MQDGLLRQKKMHPAKCAHLDLSRVLYQPEVDDPNKRRQSVKQDHGLEKELDYQLLDLCRNAIEKKEKVTARSVRRFLRKLFVAGVPKVCPKTHCTFS